MDMNNVSGTTTQSFILNASQTDVFSNIVSNGKAYLWFSDEGIGSNNFNLISARLDVFGTTSVPEPGSFALLGTALAAALMMRRKAR